MHCRINDGSDNNPAYLKLIEYLEISKRTKKRDKNVCEELSY